MPPERISGSTPSGTPPVAGVTCGRWLDSVSSVNHCAGLVHELVQQQVVLGQQQAALVQLQTETVRLGRLLIMRVLRASTVYPEMTSERVEREVVATEPAGVPMLSEMGLSAWTGTREEGQLGEQSQQVLLALAYFVAIQAELVAAERSSRLVAVREELHEHIGTNVLSLEQALSKVIGLFETAGSPDRLTLAMRRLTSRQREVAVLVAKGLTNRQIAEQLVIAERTADTHVQNILAKLGCASRSQVAALVAMDTEA